MRVGTAWFGLGLLCSVVSAGCMLSPHGETVVATTQTPIQVSGCSLVPNAQIKIEVHRHGTAPGTLLATLNAPTTPDFTDSQNFKWYCWRRDVRVSRDHWVGPPNGPFLTFIRSIDNGSLGGPTWTYANDPRECPKPWGYEQLTNAVPCALKPNIGTIGYVGVRALAPF